MIEIQPPLERAILVSAPVRGSDHEVHAEEHLDELERLADTAGAEVVGRVVQRLKKVSPRLLIGSGKLEELRDLVASTEATLVIFDEELSPVQGKNLEEALQVRVMDRAELILDIFATRARTNEAKMQVELAQSEYLLPRLARMWTHLSRIRGGIGLRGPGETQIETDRRLIRRKISQLKKKLEGVIRHREVLRKGHERRGVQCRFGGLHQRGEIESASCVVWRRRVRGGSVVCHARAEPVAGWHRAREDGLKL